MRTAVERFRSLRNTIIPRLGRLRLDDRGEINSNVAWTGAMVLLAVTIAGIIAARATGFAENISFGD